MPSADLFSVFAEIAREHRAAPPRGPTLVIPVLVDALESRRALLEQAAEFLGGMLLDLTAGDYAIPIAAYDDSGLRAEIEAGLLIEKPRMRVELKLSFTNGVIDASLWRNATLVTVPTAADEELLALGRALFDERLLSCELAMLLLSENSFDKYSRARVLQMLTGLADRPDLRLGSARTLAVFIQSDELSISRHCQPKRGVRFSLTGDRLVRRNGYQRLPDTVRQLVATRDQPLVLFLGAGFSASSGMPIGNGLRDEAIKQICELGANDARNSHELALVLHEYATSGGRNWLSARELDLSPAQFARTVTLEQVARIQATALDVPIPPVLTEFKATHDERIVSGEPFGQAVYALYDIIERGGRLVLVTVNFDELIEREHADQLDVAVTDQEFGAMRSVLEDMRGGAAHPTNKIPLLKLHGTISDLGSCVLTDEQARSGISEAKQKALIALVDGLDERTSVPWTYVGASMRDIDLDPVLSLRQFNKATNERWVTPYPEESVQRFIDSKKRFWSARETVLDRTITEMADAFMAELAIQWPQ